MSDEKTTILVSMDSLLDTRLGTIARIDTNVVNKLLLDGEYHTRDIDEFSGVDMETYRELYKNRNVETLANSILTNMMSLLRTMVLKLQEQSETTPVQKKINIVVNLYPYELNGEERTAVGAAILTHLPDTVKIEFVSISPRELTPIYCKNNFTVMIMYNYEEWLEVNAELFLVTQIPEITLFIPAIYFVKKPTPNELEKMIKESVHPMKALKTLAMGIITLEIIDISFYSIINEKL